MTIKLVIIILSVMVHCWSAPSNGGCSIHFPKKDDRLQPLLLTNKTKWSYDFYIPNGKNLDIGIRESLTFLCSPKGNAIEGENTNLTSYPCSSADTFIQKGKNVPFDNIRCKSIVKGSTITTNIRCGNNMGRIINIGYQVTRTQFLTLIQSCYDSKAGNPLYTNHTVYGQAIPAFSAQSHRPPFSEEAIPYNLEANNLYKQERQKQEIAARLGSTALVNKYYPKSQFLSRGHLSPDADFVYAPMQFTTYFFVNVNPQWQSINAGNWLAIESMVRRLAGKLKVPLQVYTGSHDVLTLPDKNNNPVELYLDFQNRMPVPKYLWKIIYNTQSKEGIALIAINNPFLSYVSDDDIICPDVCDQYYWEIAAFKTIKKGYVYCCEVQELKNVVPTIPYLNIRGVLSA